MLVYRNRRKWLLLLYIRIYIYTLSIVYWYDRLWLVLIIVSDKFSSMVISEIPRLCKRNAIKAVVLEERWRGLITVNLCNFLVTVITGPSGRDDALLSWPITWMPQPAYATKPYSDVRFDESTSDEVYGEFRHAVGWRCLLNVTPNFKSSLGKGVYWSIAGPMAPGMSGVAYDGKKESASGVKCKRDRKSRPIPSRGYMYTDMTMSTRQGVDLSAPFHLF